MVEAVLKHPLKLNLSCMKSLFTDNERLQSSIHNLLMSGGKFPFALMGSGSSPCSAAGCTWWRAPWHCYGKACSSPVLPAWRSATPPAAALIVTEKLEYVARLPKEKSSGEITQCQSPSSGQQQLSSDPKHTGNTTWNLERQADLKIRAKRRSNWMLEALTTQRSQEAQKHSAASAELRRGMPSRAAMRWGLAVPSWCWVWRAGSFQHDKAALQLFRKSK